MILLVNTVASVVLVIASDLSTEQVADGIRLYGEPAALGCISWNFGVNECVGFVCWEHSVLPHSSHVWARLHEQDLRLSNFKIREWAGLTWEKA